MHNHLTDGGLHDPPPLLQFKIIKHKRYSLLITLTDRWSSSTRTFFLRRDSLAALRLASNLACTLAESVGRVFFLVVVAFFAGGAVVAAVWADSLPSTASALRFPFVVALAASILIPCTVVMSSVIVNFEFNEGSALMTLMSL